MNIKKSNCLSRLITSSLSLSSYVSLSDKTVPFKKIFRKMTVTWHSMKVQDCLRIFYLAQHCFSPGWALLHWVNYTIVLRQYIETIYFTALSSTVLLHKYSLLFHLDWRRFYVFIPAIIWPQVLQSKLRLQKTERFQSSGQSVALKVTSHCAELRILQTWKLLHSAVKFKQYASSISLFPVGSSRHFTFNE